MGDIERLGDNLAGVREMVEETARRSVGRMNRAEETWTQCVSVKVPQAQERLKERTPRLGQQLSNGRRFELGEEGSPMDAPEVREVAVEVEFLSDNRITGGLLEIETGLRDEVAGGKEVRKFLADVKVNLANGLLNVSVCECDHRSARTKALPL
jgi:hypothetical protein